MTEREERTAQMQVTVRMIREGTKGSCFWAAPSRADELLKNGQARIVNDIPRPPTTGILERPYSWPMDRFSRVLPIWKGKRAVILGGGPSLTPEQFEIVRRAREADRCRVIAINDAYLMAPWADVNYFADSEWWMWQIEGRPKPMLRLTADDVRARFASFAGEKCSIQNTGMNITDPHVHLLRNLHGKINGPGLSHDQTMLATGRHSGHQSINLAFLAGSLDLVLCGFDAREPNIRAPGEQSHWFGAHPRLEPSQVYMEIRNSFRVSAREFEAAGLRILNASLSSAIEQFPRVPLADALA